MKHHLNAEARQNVAHALDFDLQLKIANYQLEISLLFH
jgi:hypothetical protein